MQKKLYCSPQKKLCGVCAGIADYFNIDPTIVRLIAVEIAIFTAIVPCLLAYFIMALIIPQPTAEYEQMFNNTSKRLYKSNDKKIAGVCGGIGEFFNIDPTLVRLLFFLLILILGNGVLTYIACAVIFPHAPQEATAQDYGFQQPFTQPPFEGQPQPEPQPEPQPQPEPEPQPEPDAPESEQE